MTGRAGLLIIDMLNDLEFAGGEKLAPKALAAARVIARLRDHARDRRMPVIYVNDNHKAWQSDRDRIIAHALRKNTRGAEMSRLLAPGDDDYFVIKPRVSGFYATNLQVLLPELGVTRLILTGVAADICVLFTAADAHMREYDLWVPADTVASENDQRAEWALHIMRDSMDAKICATSALPLENWLQR